MTNIERMNMTSNIAKIQEKEIKKMQVNQLCRSLISILRGVNNG